MSDPPNNNSSTISTNKVTASHYAAHADQDSYEDAYFYEPGAYMAYLVQLTTQRMQLLADPAQKNRRSSSNNTSQENRHRRRILDIGGGTGNFAQALIDSATTATSSSSLLEVIVVDPFLDPTTTSSSNDSTSLSSSQLLFVKASAEEFLQTTTTSDKSWWREAGSYHQILLKEIVHHLEAKNRVEIFRGMHQGLAKLEKNAAGSPSSSSQKSAPPSILIVTRPQVDVDYPLWDAARQVWKDNQPSVEELVQDLHAAGFQHIQHTLEVYPCSISLKRWQSMVRKRFWSTFSNFTDFELETACAIIASDYQDRVDDIGNIHFEDRLVFLSAGK